MNIYLIITLVSVGFVFAILIIYLSKIKDKQIKLRTSREKISEEQKNIALKIKKIQEQQKNRQTNLEQKEKNFHKVINDLKEKFSKEKDEIIDERTKLKQEWNKIEIINNRLKINEEKLKVENQKIENAKKYFEEQFEQLHNDRERFKQEKKTFQIATDEINSKIRHLQDRLDDQKKEIELQKQNNLEENNRLEKLEDQIITRERELQKNEEGLEDLKKFLDIKEQNIKNKNIELIEKENKFKKEIEEFGKKKQTNDTSNKDINNFFSEEKTLVSGEASQNKSIDKIPHRRTNPKNFPEKDHTKLTENKQKHRIKKLFPELICKKKGQLWHLELKFLGNVNDFSDIQISQTSNNIVADGEDKYKIEKAEPLLVSWDVNGLKKKKQFDIFGNSFDYISVFKIYTQNQDASRYVKEISYSSYCAIVPESLQRDEELSGEASREPEHFSISGYKVHFFQLSKVNGFIIAFKDADGNKIKPVFPKNSRFNLSGNIIEDYAEDIGPLFGDELPTIYDNFLWEYVETIIIGEEGENANLLWEIKPESLGSNLDLNLLEQQNKIGIISESLKSWFFILMYDKKDNLIDSLDFRFIKGLKKIKVQNHSIIPGPNGHVSARLNFVHNNKCTVNIIKDEKKKISIDSIEDGTQAIIPAEPAWDLTYWELKEKSGRKIEIETLIERIWWSLYDERNEIKANDWTDKPFNLTENYFSANSPYAISIWLPKPGWIHQFSIGFKKMTSQSRKINARQRKELVYLREFSNCEEITNHMQNSNLNLWINLDDNEKKLALITFDLSCKPKLEPKKPTRPIDINKEPCCNNCFHARVRLENYWCRRSHWPQQRNYESFKENIAYYKCGEWRGELDSDE
ncbi:hypothetical protein H8E88_34585 [candidate division KSB1 bacterium]|nr:hypothetical protein [candidate division KSB1 bacterium]